MAKRKTPTPTPEPAADEFVDDGPDYALVLPLSLLAGGLAAYPSLSAAAEGEGDLLGAVTLFLAATLVATLGFGAVAVLFHNFSRGDGDDDAGDTDKAEAGTGDRPVMSGPADDLETDGPVPTVALNPPHDPRSDAIDTALAPTDALVHD